MLWSGQEHLINLIIYINYDHNYIIIIMRYTDNGMNYIIVGYIIMA